MFQYFQTTTIILLWAVVLSFLWSITVYLLPFSEGKSKDNETKQFIMPTLLFAPLLIFLVFKLFEINLIFPVAMFSTAAEISVSAVIPAAVLCVATGVFFSISAEIRSLKSRFMEAGFAKLTEAVGLSSKKRLLKLIVSKSLVDSWASCLPWVFGEIIIVEALFNAPGLGLDIWHMARMRDLEGFFSGLVWLMAMYFILSFFASRYSKSLGKKLEGYS